MGNGDREGEPEEGRGIKLLGLMSSSSLATTSVSKNNRRKGNSFILNGFGADEWPETSGQALRSMHTARTPCCTCGLLGTPRRRQTGFKTTRFEKIAQKQKSSTQ